MQAFRCYVVMVRTIRRVTSLGDKNLLASVRARVCVVC